MFHKALFSDKHFLLYINDLPDNLRYANDGSIHEEFVKVAETEQLDAQGLKSTIVHCLEDIGVDVIKCIGQAYDGR